jgi:hypothetical protein
MRGAMTTTSTAHATRDERLEVADDTLPPLDRDRVLTVPPPR